MDGINFLQFLNPFNPGDVVVKKGETLYSIAKANNISVKELKKANGLKTDKISLGQNLVIPGNKTVNIFGFPQKAEQNKEFSLYRTPPDDKLMPAKANRFIHVRKNHDYVIRKDDNPDAIAKKFKVMTSSLLEANNMKEDSVLSIGKTIKIPDTLTAKNVKSVSDVAKAAGFSEEYINKLIDLEEFRTQVYRDKNGNRTIGVGHLVTKEEESKYAGKTLSKQEVYTLLAQDLIDREQNIKSIVGKTAYAKIPQPLKDSLMDFVFNRGESRVENHPDFVKALKERRYADSIAKMTIDYTEKNVNGKKVKIHLSGLSKRRLYEIAHASQIFNGKIPQNVLQSAQHVYNQGLYNMRKEFPNKKDFEAQKEGYNKEIEALFGDKIRLLNDKKVAANK